MSPDANRWLADVHMAMAFLEPFADASRPDLTPAPGTLFADGSLADVVTTTIALTVVTLSSAGSIGPSSLLVPLFLFFSQGRSAIPLSTATVMGGAFANACIRWRQRHPNVDRPLIALDVALMFEPMTLVGTLVGVTLNAMLPGWLLTALLVPTPLFDPEARLLLSLLRASRTARARMH